MNATDFNQPMNTIMDDSQISRLQQSRAATANEAAGMVFPQIATHFDAFWEEAERDLSGASTLSILDLNDDFWSLSIGPSGTPEAPIVFSGSEARFRQYNASKGVYQPVAESTVAGQIISNLELCADFLPPRLKHGSFIALKNRQRIKSVVERAKDLLAVNEDYFKNRQYLHLALSNGVLQIDNKQFHPSEPGRPVRETLPVKYDPDAKCEIFLRMFLANILSSEDIDLLQRYLSQVLEGINHSQTILILTGDSGWGKSSLMKIIGTLIGWKRVGIIREQLFKDEFELAHYANKHFLFHPDMRTDFLQRKEASIFKQLCGGDPLWANVKGDDERMVLQGNYPIILACNGRPKIHLDEDADAWSRRLVVLSFKTPTHEQHMGKMAELIMKTESSGILNWLLEGRQKLAKDKLQLIQTPEQKARAATLLLASDSPSAFVCARLEKRDGAEVTAMDLYGHYQKWCQENDVRPFASQAFTQMAKEQIEFKLGMRYRHDLGGEQGTNRGWKGVGIVSPAEMRMA